MKGNYLLLKETAEESLKESCSSENILRVPICVKFSAWQGSKRSVEGSVHPAKRAEEKDKGRKECFAKGEGGALLGACSLFATLVLSQTVEDYLTETYQYTEQVHPEYVFRWTAIGGELHFALEVNTHGWIGWGFGEPTSGSMPGADIVTVIVPSTGEAILEDRWSSAFELPHIDECQDYELVSASSVVIEGVKKTVVELKRKLDTGDSQDRVIAEGLTRVIMAWGNDAQTTVTYHSANRAVKSLELIPGAPAPITPPGAQTKSYNFPNITIPPQETSYLCSSFQLPQLDAAQIISMSPNLNPNTRQYTHHLVVMSCESERSWFYRKYQQEPGGDCLFIDPPDHSQYPNDTDFDDNCQTGIFYVWAGEDVEYKFPENAGLRFSKDVMSHVVVQIHYTNPQRDVGVIDDSAFSMTYITENFRPDDVGILIVGDPGVNFPPIPARSPSVHYEAECPSVCTEKFTNPIHVFGDMMHMHFSGEHIWNTLSRDGEFLGITNGAEYYDYELQQISTVNFTINPGDRINLHCEYNTADRNTETVFGPSSYDEMCMSFYYYYPKVDVAICGYFSEEETICGYEMIDYPNPSIRDDPSTYLRTDFGEPGSCKAVGDDDDGEESFWESETYVAVVSVALVVFILITLILLVVVVVMVVKLKGSGYQRIGGGGV
eukprot:CAMPEP_0174259122 /NCGR_PEP_ID=MMETSP0439-20130205/7994_1 /TAXON_ID=0 /ORGANISM="Stereomyxa ramosa, Strain Chinc5" /LENGTH=662 /DNA_ID=CAMNT_0015342897 /DNA_START=1104 /DNA_END=3094 /DNA_ORIENTATION=+